MDKQAFLNRFKSNSAIQSPEFDRAEAARWAEAFRATLPAKQEAMATKFQQALETVGGKFYSVDDNEDVARIVVDLTRASGTKSVIAWSHPALDTARAALQLAGIPVYLSERAAGYERADIRAATIASDIGLTSCNYAIAETGTLMLIAHAQQGRLTSLLPITHIAIITPAQFVPTLADALKLVRLARLDSSDGRLPSNISLHTGPSRTADIEQTLTKGVHGPKEVHVILTRANQVG
jgi:L-lactate dehydrogenase complex protein LldG